jgi:hypothetical protein
MESYCSLCTFKVPQGANNLILCTLDTIHWLFFVTRLIINQINKVQWVDFKLENILVSLHSLKTMGLGSIIFKEWRVTWHSPIHNVLVCPVRIVQCLQSLKKKEWVGYFRRKQIPSQSDTMYNMVINLIYNFSIYMFMYF